MKKIAVIVAAGSGTRMQSSVPKQFLKIGEKPILWYTVKAFMDAYPDIKIILVLPHDFQTQGEQIAREFNTTSPMEVITGGHTRFQSVKNGLDHVHEPSIIFIHDGVRCLITPELIKNCYSQAVEKGSAIPAVEVSDSLRILEKTTSKALDRSQVRVIQTPQTFRSADLIAAYNQPYQSGFTDEASVVEAAGHPVYLIEGASSNIKITRPIDLILAAEILKQRHS